MSDSHDASRKVMDQTGTDRIGEVVRTLGDRSGSEGCLKAESTKGR